VSRRRPVRVHILALVSASLLLGAAGCHLGGDESGSPEARRPSSAAPSPTQAMQTLPAGVTVPLVHPGQLTICQWLGGAPFWSVQSGGTKATGFNASVLALAAERLGVAPLVIDAERTDLEGAQALGRKVCDVSAGRFFALPPGDPDALPIDYTVPYFQRSTAILAGSDSGYKTLASLRGKRVGVAQGDEASADMARAAGLAVQEYDSQIVAPMIRANRLDAAIVDSAIALNAQKQGDGQLIATTGLGTSTGVVFAVRKGNSVLRTQLDAALTDAGRNGHYAAAYREWFAGEPTYVPGR
jgi:polar amino acid transport system substrate-binding protein